MIPSTDKYRAAIELYGRTELPAKEICDRLGVSTSAFKAYVWRYHRDLMLRRHGMEAEADKSATKKLRGASGQSVDTREKYREAIEACSDPENIAESVSEIARRFGLNPTGLGNQLRRHHPDILEERNRMRERLNIGTVQNGARSWCQNQYAAAIAHLRESNDTIKHTAEIFGLSHGGLREHIRYYHKDLVRDRRNRRHEAMKERKRGGIDGNGKVRRPKAESIEKYAAAIELLREGGLTRREVASRTGVNEFSLGDYLRKWHPDLLPRRRRQE